MNEFRSVRVVKQYTMTLVAPPGDVFPLLCPVREYEWVEPWSCDMVFSQSGVAENNAVFRTDFPPQGGEEIWVVCRYEKNVAIEFIRVTPSLKVSRLDINLTAAGETTLASWTQTYTGLSEAGNEWIRNVTDDTFRSEKATIEKMLNHYLETGKMLKMPLTLASDPYGQKPSH